MLTLYCSQKLQKYIGFKENQIEQGVHTPINSWNGHLFSIEKKKGLIFMNHKTYFSVVLYPFKKSDLKNLNE